VGVDPFNLRPNSKVRFPGYSGVHSIEKITQGAYWEFIVRTDDGQYFGITLDEDEITDIELIAESPAPTFDGDPRQFRLGVEATRIQNAFRHDMAALAVSQISPLPHQLEAVYGSFLTEPRLSISAR
jgi:hypothetical protein